MRSPEEVAVDVRSVYGGLPLAPSDKPMVRAGMREALKPEPGCWLCAGELVCSACQNKRLHALEEDDDSR